MKSLLSKILLVVIALFALLSVFIPYAQIPGIELKQEFDLSAATITINVGKEISTYNFNSAVSPNNVYEIFYDKEHTKKIDVSKLPLVTGDNSFYLRLYATGGIAGTTKSITNVLTLDEYNLLINRGATDALTVNFDSASKTIKISMDNSVANFDFNKIIVSTKAWSLFSDKAATKKLDSTAVLMNKDTADYYAAITIPGAKADQLVPLKIYALTINHDTLHQTKPIISKFGLAFGSSIKGAKLGPDTFIFIDMILSAIVLLGSFMISAKIRIVELILAILLGVYLIAIPILEIGTLTNTQYQIKPGLYIVIAVGAITIGLAIYNFIIERKEYKIERQHLEDIHKVD